MENINVSNLTIKLRGQVLFENISFEIKEGDRIMFLGKNGSGKSLFLELLSFGITKDLLERYKGLEVTGHIFDSNGNDLLDSNVSRKFSYVSQAEEFYNNSTILDEARVACYGVGLDLDEDYLDYLLNKFNLKTKKKQKIKNNVSFGEGKAIHLITRILKMKATNTLILDEPLNHLSFQNSKTFNDIINDEISKNPKLTIIMISHCKAVDFIQKTMKYNYETKRMEFYGYTPVDCFKDEI